MTNKEAYIWILDHFAPCDDGTKQDEALGVALKALEKQTPMKPILLDDEDLICPVCDADVEWKRYCENCGQKIDWGES